MSIRQLLSEVRCRFDEAFYRTTEAIYLEPRGNDAGLNVGAFEDRVMFSATPIDVAAIVGDAGLDEPVSQFAYLHESAEDVSAGSELVADQHSQAEQSTRELVFVDRSAQDYEQLLDDLILGSDESRQFEVVLLDSERDGVEQISEHLADTEGIDAIHIVSHGSEGNVRLGNTWLSLNNLAAYTQQLAAWDHSLTSDADLLIYGCDLASTSAGKDFVEALILTGTDVAASDDDTGHAQLGGDWTLEYAAGAIETEIAFSNALQKNWSHLLATTETHYFLTGSGIPAATLDTPLPTATTLQDYDSGRHVGDGTLIQKGGVGFGESDPVKHQLWETSSGNIDIDGPVKLSIWSAMKDFDDAKGATVNAYLIDIHQNGSGATEIGSASIARGAWNPDGDWVEDTFDFGNITRSLGNVRRLQIKLVVDGASGDDMIFAYDDIFHRSVLQVGKTTSNGDPLLNSGGGSLNYTEGDPATPIAPSLTLSDDDVNMQWAVAQITGNFQAGEDVLSFSGPPPGGLSMNYDPNTGQMVFNGTSSVANYRTALQGVRYNNSSEGPDSGPRTVSFSVYDGQNLSTATRGINLTPDNDPPTISATAAGSGLEDQNVVYTHAQMLTLIGGNDVDNATADLTIAITNVNNASFVKSGSGDSTTYTFNLTQPADSNGYAITFDYEITDLQPLSSGVGAATINVLTVNDEPGLTIGSDENVNEDTGLHSVASFASATPGGGPDESGQTFTYLVNNDNGSLFSVAPAIDPSGTLTYTLAADAIGTAIVTVSVQDSGGTANSGDNTSPNQQFNINVANANNDNAFVAVNTGLTVNENATLGISASELRVDDLDLPAASTLSYIVALGPTQGQLELTTAPTVGITAFTQDDINTGKLVYAHFGAEAPLSDSFTFTAWDGIGTPTAPQAFNISISAQNDAPLNAVPGTQYTLIDTALILSTGNSNSISVSDDDAGGGNVEVTLNVTNGTVTLDPPVNTATAAGPEASSPSSNTGVQRETRVATAPDGRYVVVWSGAGPGDGDGIYMRQFLADGTPVGNQIRVNGNGAKADPQDMPSVAVNDSGRIVIGWSSANQDFGSTDGVYFRAKDWDGSNDTGELLANSTTAGDQDEPSVAIDNAGNVVVVWTDHNFLDSHNEGVFARRFNSAGTEINAEWQVNDYSFSKQWKPDIAMDASGNFVIVWQSQNQEPTGTQYGVFAKRYDFNATEMDAPGTPGDAEFQVNVTVFKNQHAPSVSMDNSGNFVVVWASQEQAGDGDDDGIFGQLFDSAGNKTGPTEFQVSTATAWDQTNPSVTMDATGDFAVAWEHDSTALGPKDIRFQQFDKFATKVGTEQTAHTPTTGEQSDPDIGMDAAGNFVIVWDGQTTTEGDDGAVAQRYELPPPTLTFTSGDGINDSFVRFRGSVANVNAALDGLVFRPTTSFIGTATINVDVNDLGNTGPGGAKSDNDNININVTTTPVGLVSDTDAAIEEVAEDATVGTSVGITAFADDPDPSDTVSYSLDNDAGGLFDIHTTTGVVTVKAALDYETATSHNIVVRATSTDTSSTTQGYTINVTDVAATFTVSGDPTVDSGNLYTLNLNPVDPGLNSITGWTIVWGDGAIDTIAGNPSTATHTYTNTGFTNNVLVSMTDATGTYFQNELLVASSGTDSLMKYGTDRGFLLQFALPPDLATPDYPVDTIIGPDGNLYVSGWNSSNVLRYDPATGAFIDEFVAAGDGGLDSAAGLAFGPDGNLYVASRNTSQVLRFQGPGGATPGLFIDVFADVSPMVAGDEEPEGLAFGPDGNLYVSDYKFNAVYKFDGLTGAPILTTGHPLGEFVAPGAGLLNAPEELIFGPDGNLYVASDNSHNVLRYDGTTGAFIDEFVATNDGGLQNAQGLNFGPDGNFYVGSWGSDAVLRYQGLDGVSPGAFIDEYIIAGSGGLDQTTYFSFLTEHQITVTVNDPPTISNLAGDTLAYAEDDAATVIEQGGDVLVTDGDSTNFNTGNLSVSIASGGDNSEDVLSIRDQGAGAGNITLVGVDVFYDFGGGPLQIGSFTGGIGGADLVVTLNAAANATATEALIANITYRNTDTEIPTTTPRTVRFTLNDGEGGTSAAHDATVSVTAVNDSPTVAVNTGTTVAEGSVGNVVTSAMLGEGDVDDSGTGLTYTVTGGLASGAIKVGGVASSTFTQADIDGGQVTYEHDGSETTSDSFNFSLADGGEDSATPATGVFNITVTAVNDSPTVTVNTGTTVAEGSVGNVITAAMLGEGDVDDSGAGLTYTVTGGLASGAIKVGGVASSTFTQADIDGGQVTYEHDGSETTSDSFNFSLADGGEDSATPATGVFNITVTAVNDSPTVAVNTGTGVSRGSIGNVIASAILDEGDPDDSAAGLTYTITSGPANGTIKVSGVASSTFKQADIDGGLVSYDHDGSLTTTDSFNFSLADGGEDGATPATGVFNISVSVGNVAPSIAVNTGTSVLEGSPGNVITTAMLNEGDPDDSGIGLTYTITSGPAEGVIKVGGVASSTFTQADIDGGLVTYTHDGSETTTDSFNFSLADGGEDGSTPATSIFNITVTAVNDSPSVAVNTGATVTKGSTGNIISSPLLNEGDPDDSGTGLTYTLTSAPVNGTVKVSGVASSTFTQADIDGGLVTYDHNGSLTFSDSFDFVLADGGEDGATTTLGTFNWTILGSNAAPTVSALEAGVLVFTEGDTPIALTAAAVLADTDHTHLTSATIQIGAGYETGKDKLSFVDTLSITGTWDAATGSLTLVGTDTVANYQAALRSVTFENTSDSPSTSPRSVLFRVSDGLSPSITAFRTVQVVGVNDKPLALSDSYSTNSDTPLSVAATGLLGNDSDVEGDSLTSMLITGAANGSVTLATDGSFLYVPNPGFFGTDSFTYVASDGLLQSDPVSANITVTSIVLPPTLIPSPTPDPPTSDTPDSISITVEPSDDDEDESDTPIAVADSSPRITTPDFPPNNPNLDIKVSDSAEDDKPTADLIMMLNAADTDKAIVPVAERMKIGVASRVEPETIAGVITIDASEHFRTQYVVLAKPGEMWNELDSMRHDVENDIAGGAIMVGTAGVAASGLTVGYVIWMIRGGFLLSGLLAQMPAWRLIDPLIVMQGIGSANQSGESLQDIIDSGQKRLDARSPNEAVV